MDCDEMFEYIEEKFEQSDFSWDYIEYFIQTAQRVDSYSIIRPLINDFLRKMAKFRHQENQDVSAGTRIRFFIDKPAAMISFPRAVIKYL